MDIGSSKRFVGPGSLVIAVLNNCTTCSSFKGPYLTVIAARQPGRTGFPEERGFLKYPKPLSDLESGEMTFAPVGDGAKPGTNAVLTLLFPILHIIKATPFFLTDLKLTRNGKSVSVTHFMKRGGSLQWRGPDSKVVARTYHIVAWNEMGGGAKPDFCYSSCLRPNLTKGVANWPGVEGQNQQSARQEVPLPYETEVGMKEKLMESPCSFRLYHLTNTFHPSVLTPQPYYGLSLIISIVEVSLTKENVVAVASTQFKFLENLREAHKKPGKAPTDGEVKQVTLALDNRVDAPPYAHEAGCLTSAGGNDSNDCVGHLLHKIYSSALQ
ncbi:hypothetical protein ECG_07817 [Echinococcus granulosus]|nr:hypothetical protein ECG_07817 [Echinococcus granulosus]